MARLRKQKPTIPSKKALKKDTTQLNMGQVQVLEAMSDVLTSGMVQNVVRKASKAPVVVSTPTMQALSGKSKERFQINYFFGGIRYKRNFERKPLNGSINKLFIPYIYSNGVMDNRAQPFLEYFLTKVVPSFGFNLGDKEVINVTLFNGVCHIEIVSIRLSLCICMLGREDHFDAIFFFNMEFKGSLYDVNPDIISAFCGQKFDLGVGRGVVYGRRPQYIESFTYRQSVGLDKLPADMVFASQADMVYMRRGLMEHIDSLFPVMTKELADVFGTTKPTVEDIFRAAKGYVTYRDYNVLFLKDNQTAIFVDTSEAKKVLDQNADTYEVFVRKVEFPNFLLEDKG